MSQSTLFTIGYAGKDIKGFIDLLRGSDISTLVDVRQIPISRKKDFSKTRLASCLQASGIEYKHFGILGSPKALREKVKEDNDYQFFFEGYSDYLNTRLNELDDLSDIATQKKICLMCVEPKPTQCHRQIIAQAVSKNNSQVKVVHL